MLSKYYCILSILVTTVIIRSDAAINYCSSTSLPLQPEFSTTFLNGSWYEYLFSNTSMNEEACSHFQIDCNSNTSSSSCDIEHVIWKSYKLTEIWKGAIIQNDDDSVRLTINATDYSNVHLKFHDKAVIIWGCKDADDELEFASVLIRIENDQKMENVWKNANSIEYLSILDEFPAGIWNKDDTKDCASDAGTFVRTFSPRILATLLLVTLIIQKCAFRVV